MTTTGPTLMCRRSTSTSCSFMSSTQLYDKFASAFCKKTCRHKRSIILSFFEAATNGNSVREFRRIGYTQECPVVSQLCTHAVRHRSMGAEGIRRTVQDRPCLAYLIRPQGGTLPAELSLNNETPLASGTTISMSHAWQDCSYAGFQPEGQVSHHGTARRSGPISEKEMITMSAYSHDPASMEFTATSHDAQAAGSFQPYS